MTDDIVFLPDGSVMLRKIALPADERGESVIRALDAIAVRIESEAEAA